MKTIRFTKRSMAAVTMAALWMAPALPLAAQQTNEDSEARQQTERNTQQQTEQDARQQPDRQRARQAGQAEQQQAERTRQQQQQGQGETTQQDEIAEQVQQRLERIERQGQQTGQQQTDQQQAGQQRQQQAGQQQTGRQQIDQRQAGQGAAEELKREPTQPRAETAAELSDPEVTWVWAGYDTDGDGELDVYEYLHSTDLMRARQTTVMRMGDEPSLQKLQQASRQMRGLRAENLRRVEGEILEIKQMELDQPKGTHSVARIENGEGRVARVDLGSKSKTDSMNLSQGDELTVYGTRGTINERPVLMAQTVTTADGQRLEIDRPRGERMQRITGEIVSTRTVTMNEEEQPHLLARVRQNEGRTMVVDFGPEEALSEVELSEGTQVSLLGKRCVINDRPAVEAHRLRVGERTLEISQPGPRVKESQGQADGQPDTQG